MNYRKILITALTFLGGVYFFLEFVLPENLPPALGGYQFGKYHDQITNGFRAVGAMAFALGLINILLVHGSKVIFRRAGLLNSLVLIVSMFLMMFFTALDWKAGGDVNKEVARLRNLAAFSKRIVADYEQAVTEVGDVYDRTDKLLVAVESEKLRVRKELSDLLNLDPEQSNSSKLQELEIEQSMGLLEFWISHLKLSINSEILESEVTVLNEFAAALSELALKQQKYLLDRYQTSYINKVYQFLYSGLFIPLGSAMFSLLGFYIVSAAYRAFRVKSGESALMMLAALLVMLGQIPFYDVISDELPNIRLWLLEVPNSAAFRGIKFGAAIAGLIMAFRMWLSIESTSFAKDEV